MYMICNGVGLIWGLVFGRMYALRKPMRLTLRLKRSGMDSEYVVIKNKDFTDFREALRKNNVYTIIETVVPHVLFHLPQEEDDA
jgi:hypothetical protein